MSNPALFAAEKKEIKVGAGERKNTAEGFIWIGPVLSEIPYE